MRLLFLLLLCAPLAADQMVLVSVAPYCEVVKAIGGDTIRCELLAPKGSCSHSAEPTPSQLLGASDADVWFLTGEPFERKALGVLRQHNPSLVAIDLRQGLSTDGDPHIWMSYRLMATQAITIATALTEAFPDLAPTIDANLKAYLNELTACDDTATALLAPCQGTTLLVAHPAFGLFCRDYGLEQLAIEEDDKEPTIKQLAALIATAKEEQIPRIIALPHHTTKAALLIAKETGIPIVEFNPCSVHYLQMMGALTALVANE